MTDWRETKMPRKFDFRKDFSQLDIKKVTQDEMYQAITNEQIQALLDMACQGYNVELEKVQVPSDTNYASHISFESYKLEDSDIGVLSCFMADDDAIKVKGEIYAKAELRPYYTATVVCSKGYSQIAKVLRYVLRFGSDTWEFKGKDKY